MAIGIIFRCTRWRCRRTIMAWDDGNPYYYDDDGNKKYAYHPNREWGRCFGNDRPHLCLACGHEFVIDSQDPISACPACTSTEIVATFELKGRRCPLLQEGEVPRHGQLCHLMKPRRHSPA
jgi:uncharacterized CHY-type Zn-finger protein